MWPINVYGRQLQFSKMENMLSSSCIANGLTFSFYIAEQIKNICNYSKLLISKKKIFYQYLFGEL